MKPSSPVTKRRKAHVRVADGATRRRARPGRVFLVLSTAPAPAARRIARALVEAQLAACVNLLPRISSVFRWEGRVDRTAESLLLIKTTGGALRRCRARLERLHPYEVPEWIAFEVDRVADTFHRWLEASVLQPSA